MQFQTLAYTEKDGILHVKFNRPEKRNVINELAFTELQQCFAEVATKDSVEVVLLSGVGKGFSAGTDLTSFHTGDSQQEVRRMVRRYSRAFTEIELVEKAVIALIHGFCFGAALEIALACDLRICTPEVMFTLPEVNVGVVPDGGSSQRLPRVIGLGRAKEMILMAKMIDAQKAYDWGLVNEVVKPEELENTGIKWAKEIINNSVMGVGLSKRNIDMSMNMSFWDAMECTGLAQSLAFTDPSFVKRMEKRFLEMTKGKKSE